MRVYTWKREKSERKERTNERAWIRAQRKENLLRRWTCCYVIKNEHIMNSFDDLSARLTPKCMQPMSISTMFLDAFVGVEHVLGISHF